MESTLDQALTGKTYEIIGIEGKSAFAKRRIMDLGLIPGVKVKVIGVAPLGDPIDIEVKGYNLSIRKSEASMVKVRMVKEAEG